MTGEGKILVKIGPTVLLRNYVLDVVRQVAVFLWQQAVLAAVIRSLPHQGLRGRIHFLTAIRLQLAYSLELQDRNEIGRIDERFILGPLVFAQDAIVSSFCKDSNPRLHSGIYAKLSHTPG